MKSIMVPVVVYIGLVFQLFSFDFTFGFRHICEIINSEQYEKLNVQSIFYDEFFLSLVVIESNYLYVVSRFFLDNDKEPKIILPPKPKGLWHENRAFFWKTKKLKQYQFSRINQFSLSNQTVALYFTVENELFYGVSELNSLYKYPDQNVTVVEVASNTKNEGYFLHKYPDGEIGIKDLPMAFKVSDSEKHLMRTKRLEKLLYQLVLASWPRYTVDLNEENQIFLHGRDFKKHSTLKSLPFVFMYYSKVFLIDVLDGNVHSFWFFDIADDYASDRVLRMDKQKFSIKDVFDCSLYFEAFRDKDSDLYHEIVEAPPPPIPPPGFRQNMMLEQNSGGNGKLFGLVGIMSLGLVALFSVLAAIWSRKKKFKTKKSKTSSSKTKTKSRTKTTQNSNRTRSQTSKTKSKTKSKSKTESKIKTKSKSKIKSKTNISKVSHSITTAQNYQK